MIKPFLLMLCSLALLVSCKTTEIKDTNATDIDIKNVDIDQAVKKRFFAKGLNVSISVPRSWSVSGQEMIEAVTEIGAKIVTGDDEVQKILHEESKKRTENLFLISQYEVGAPVSFNPSVVGVAENLALAPGVKSGKDYLYHVKALLLGSKAGYALVSDNAPTEISGYVVDSFTVSAVINGSKLYQTYHATKVDDYALSFVFTYVTEEENATFETIFQSIDINRHF